MRDLSADAEVAGLLATGQVAHALLRLADQHGRPLPDGILIDLVLSPDDLVKHTGLAPEAARTRLGHLRDLGLIRPQGTRIVIVDRDALQDYAEARPARRNDARQSCTNTPRSWSTVARAMAFRPSLGRAADGMRDDGEFVAGHAEHAAHQFSRADEALGHDADGGNALSLGCDRVVQTAR